jgi:hypothetical protein
MQNKTLLILLIIFACTSLTLAQKTEPTGLVVEVTFADGFFPKPAQIDVHKDKSQGTWFAKFPKTPKANSIEKSETVRAVNFVTKIEKDKVNVKVSVFKGEKFFDKEELVALYSLGVGDEILINKLEQFGVQPIKITLVKITPNTSILPTVVNKTQSLQVVGLEPNYSTLPTFKVKISNNSAKAVKALHIGTRIGDKYLILASPRNRYGEDLIKAGEILEKTISNNYKQTSVSKDQNLEVQSEQIFEIITVVFEDGSYEGDVRPAIDILSFYQGEEIHLKRSIPILYELMEEDDLDKISRSLSAIKTDVNNSDLEKLFNKIADLLDKTKPRPGLPVEISTRGNKKRLIDEFNEVKVTVKNSSDIKNWLKTTIERYENWLTRIPL